MGIGDEVERHGRITDGRLAEIETVLAAFRASCDKDGVTRIAAIGTAAFRDAANGARVIVELTDRELGSGLIIERRGTIAPESRRHFEPSPKGVWPGTSLQRRPAQPAANRDSTLTLPHDGDLDRAARTGVR
jgi:hypothetical protein